MDWAVARLALDLAGSFLLPILIFTALYLYYKDKPGFVQNCGLTRSEVGLLIVGAFVGMLLDLPVVIWGDSLIAINVGGGLIPVFMSIYLVKRRVTQGWNATILWYVCIAAFAALFSMALIMPFFEKYTSTVTAFGHSAEFPYLLVALAVILDAAVAAVALSGVLKGGQARALVAAVVSVQAVSFVTFYVSYIMPGTGIVSEFPYYLLPGLFGALLALLFYYDDITKVVPLAYAAGALGTLIGADISRVPLLFRELGPFAGSMGGAGAMDLVFLSGMISITVAFLFARKRDLAASREKNWIAASESRSDGLLDAADGQFAAGQYAEAAKTALSAVNEAVRTLQVRTGALARDAPFPGASQQSLEALGVHPYKAYDYRLLSETATQGTVSQPDSQNAVYAARLLVAELGRTERQLYATVGQRTLAFLVDIGILLGIVLPILFAVTLTYPSDSSGLLSYSPVFLGTVMWALSSSLVYFTALEWLFGRTVGKYVMHLTVVSKMQTRASFMQVFTRNVIRFLETMTLYVSAFVLIAVTRRAQRAGDILSGTVVIRTAAPQEQRAQPPRTVVVQYAAPAQQATPAQAATQQAPQ